MKLYTRIAEEVSKNLDRQVSLVELAELCGYEEGSRYFHMKNSRKDQSLNFETLIALYKLSGLSGDEFLKIIEKFIKSNH